MTFDADAYAEGICNSAAGSSIEVLVDLLTELTRTYGLFDDACEYRCCEDADEDADADNEQADNYLRMRDQLIELRDAIVTREKDMEDC